MSAVNLLISAPAPTSTESSSGSWVRSGEPSHGEEYAKVAERLRRDTSDGERTDTTTAAKDEAAPVSSTDETSATEPEEVTASDETEVEANPLAALLATLAAVVVDAPVAHAPVIDAAGSAAEGATMTDGQLTGVGATESASSELPIETTDAQLAVAPETPAPIKGAAPGDTATATEVAAAEDAATPTQPDAVDGPVPAPTTPTDGASAAAGEQAAPVAPAPAAADEDLAVERAASPTASDETPDAAISTSRPLHATPGVNDPAPLASVPTTTPAATSEAPAPVALAGAEADVWEQLAEVVRPLRTAPDGTQRMSLQLRPAEMGTVHLEVAVQDGRLSIRAVADNPMSRDLLLGALPELRAELSSSGVDLGSLDVGDQTAGGQWGTDADRPGRQPALQGGGPNGGPSGAGAHDGATTPAATSMRHGAGSLDLAL